MPPRPWRPPPFELAVVLVLVLLNGVFALSELALVSVRRPHLIGGGEDGCARTGRKHRTSAKGGDRRELETAVTIKNGRRLRRRRCLVRDKSKYTDKQKRQAKH